MFGVSVMNTCFLSLDLDARFNLLDRELFVGEWTKCFLVYLLVLYKYSKSVADRHHNLPLQPNSSNYKPNLRNVYLQGKDFKAINCLRLMYN